MGVGAALCSLLINACENQLGYSKPLVLLHDGVSVNATCAVGVDRRPVKVLYIGPYFNVPMVEWSG